MRRRDFMIAVSAAASWPFAARAQQTPMPVIGFLNSAWPAPWAPRVAAFKIGLGQVGYVEGQNVAIEYRWAEGNDDRLAELARDLAARGVAVIAATGGGRSARAAKRATANIPIVFTAGIDPVASGLVATLNRPGGNVTGISLLSSELTAKRLEILHDLVPTAENIAVLVNPGTAVAEFDAASLPVAANRLGVRLNVLKASSERELDRVFASLAQQRPDALLVSSSPLFESRREQLVALAARQAVPAIFDTRYYSEAGGLASYGPDYAIAYREAGAYVGRILRGARPADLPVVQLSKIELVLNAKAAKALGLTIPPSLMVRADEVIE
ncbi:MAG TPA: ABC transporter substrate-binding protein [Stellaceae bacterium]|nr:ABC transporter substrate-binding protein [Stellaceae bacterium]